MGFAPAPELPVFPTPAAPLGPYQHVPEAARATRGLVRELRPDVVVADVLTVGAALAAELEGCRVATLVPHLLPVPAPGLPPFAVGARPPRTWVGSALWRGLARLAAAGARRGRDELNDARRELGLAPVDAVHNGISRQLAIVATFPQLEAPRRAWPANAMVTGPLLGAPPVVEGGQEDPPDPEQPSERDPLVLVAPSTSQDPSGRLVRAALAGLARESVSVLAVVSTPSLQPPLAVPANARIVPWVDYAAVMPRCAAVICHGGHGTVAAALAAGVPVVVAPAGGDMAENAARVAWYGAGVSLPARLASPAGVRHALARARQAERVARAAELGRWAQRHDGAEAACRAVEALAAASPGSDGRLPG